MRFLSPLSSTPSIRADSSSTSLADKNLSRHERRLLQLASQISVLEQENVGKKHWATTGEAQSRDREKDSLLEEDLDFERMGKVAPQVTEEQTQGIEALIKKRILDVRLRSFLPLRRYIADDSFSTAEPIRRRRAPPPPRPERPSPLPVHGAPRLAVEEVPR